MKFFTTFNFDILIIIIALFGIILGILRGGYKQLQKTSSIIIPLISLYFLLPIASKLIISSDSLVEYAKLFIVGTLEKHLYLIINLFIGIVLYLFLAIIIHLIFNLFQKKNIDYYLVKKKKFGRVMAPFISLLSSYIVVFVILYISGPFVSNVNGTITSFLENSTLAINEIGTVHLYQNKYNQEFIEVKELYDYISIEEIIESFAYYSSVEESINEIELLLNENYDNLHDDSKDLLRNEKTVNKLIEKKEGAYIIDLVWKIEKKTGFFDEIKAKRNYIIDNAGFINIINSTYYENNDYMIEQIVEEKDQLSEFFGTKKSLNKFNQIVEYYQFYLDNKADLQSLIEVSDLDVFEYNQEINDIFLNNSKMVIYMNDFNLHYENTENYIFQKLIDIFNQSNEYKEQILEIDENLSFPSKFIFGKNYQNWFVNKEWLNRPLVAGYFVDELLNKDSKMHLLHKEMLLVSLLPEYGVEDKISNEDINDLISNLNTLIEKKFIYSRDKNDILKTLFLDNLFIDRIFKKELISLDTVLYAKGLIE